jgi:hypothetical protein
MTRTQYFEMCEMLGTQPVDSEIPIEYEDFPLEVQQAFSFNGIYLGKSFIGLTEVLDYMEIDHSDRKLIVQLIKVIDTIRSNEIIKTREQKPASN